MSVTPPVHARVLPVGPNTSDPDNFDAEADNLLGELRPFSVEQNALADNVYANAFETFNNAGIAAAGAAAAVAATNVLPWVSGATYTAGGPGVGASVVSSIVNFKTYRRRTNGAGAVDPSADNANWQLISAGAMPRLHVQEQRAAGVQSSTAIATSTWSQRVFNTQLFSDIPGASLSSNTVILPPGTYQCDISAGAVNPNQHRIRLFDVTNGVVLLLGTSEYLSQNFASNGRAFLKGRFTLNSSTTLRVEHWCSQNTYGGAPTTSGFTEIYGEAIFDQVEN